MSNYLSSPYEKNTPRTDENFQLLGKVMEMRQGKYDANKARIDQTLAIYKNQLKGLRDGDNEYIATRIKETEGLINNFGKGRDFSLSSTSDSLMTSLTSITEDPIIRSAVINKTKVDQYNLKVDEIRKKNGDKYSDLNYQYGLDTGGVDKYLKGEIKDIGKLDYKEYIDLPQVHSKRLMEYVAQYDDEQLLSQGSALAGTSYHTVDIYGKKVLKEDLKKFLQTSMDEKEMEQMNINAWGKFKGVSDEQVTSLVKPIYQKNLDTQQKYYETMKAQVDSGKIKDVNKVLPALELNLKQLKNKVDSNSFTKQDAYSLYSDEYLDNMASSFDKDIITKKEVEDAAFQEYKFATENKHWELTFDQKERENALKQKEVSLLEAQTFGTKTKVEQDTEGTEQEKSRLQTHYEEYDAVTKQLFSSLERDDPEFAKKNYTQKMAYINGLDFSDPTKPKGKFSKTTVDLHNSWKPMVNANREAIEEEVKSNQKIAIGAFYDMQDSHFAGNELDLENTSAYLPITSQLIKDAKSKGNKKLSWADIPTDKRYAIQAEFLNANKNFNSGDYDWDDKKMKATASYVLTSKIKDKNVLNSVITADKNYKNSDQGYIEEGWEGVKEVGKLALGVASDVGSSFKWGYNAIKEGTDYADKKFDKDMKESYKPDFNKMSGILNVTPHKFLYALSKPILREEENLENIESRDLLGRQNIGERFKVEQETLKARRNLKFDSATRNLDYKYGFSFSTENKAQKPIAEELKQLILTTKDVQDNLKPVPEKGENNYTISQKGTGYEISYIAGGDDEDLKGKITKIFVEELPANLQSSVDQTKDSWSKSFYNPNIVLPTFKIDGYETQAEAEKAVTNLINYGNIDKGTAEQIANLKSGVFKPTMEYIRQDISEVIYKANEQKVKSFLNQDFTTSTTLSQDGRVKTIVKYKSILDGQETVSEPYYPNFVEKDDALMRLYAQEKVDNIKKQELKLLK